MPVRAGIVAAVLGALLGASVSACGGGDDGDKKPSAVNTRLGTPGSKVTETVLDCARYSDTAQEILKAQQELYAGAGGGTDAVDELKTEMNALKDGAPGDVKAAIDELNEAFEKVQEMISKPTAEAQAELRELGPKLAADGQKISTYIVSQCKK